MKYPFSSQVKGELARAMPVKRCCQMAELSTILRLEGQTHADAGGVEVEVALGNPAAARKAFILFKRLVRPARMELQRQANGGKRRAYRVKLTQVTEEAAALLRASACDAEAPARVCCRRAVVRAAFLCRGSITEPERSNHVEFSVDAATERYLVACLEGLGIEARRTTRKRRPIVYLKDGEAIVELLKQVGAHNALLQLENIRIAKDVRNSINRLVNCETANVDKTVVAAMEQVQAIRFIDEAMGLRNLSKKLQAVARRRLELPYATLKELGEAMEPPISKSSVGYRIRRLVQIAEELEDRTL